MLSTIDDATLMKVATAMGEEDAVEMVFHCSTCGKPLAHCENGKFVERLSEKVEQLRKELGE